MKDVQASSSAVGIVCAYYRPLLEFAGQYPLSMQQRKEENEKTCSSGNVINQAAGKKFFVRRDEMERQLGVGKQKGSAKDWHERERTWRRKGGAKEVSDRKKLGRLYHTVKTLSAYVHKYLSIPLHHCFIIYIYMYICINISFFALMCYTVYLYHSTYVQK